MKKHSFTVFGLTSQCWLISPDTVAYTINSSFRPNGQWSDKNGNTWDELPLADFVMAFGTLESNGQTLATLLSA